MIVILAIVGGGAYLWTHRRSRTEPETSWTAPTPSTAVDHAYARPDRPPSPLRVALTLARGEAAGWPAAPTFAAAVAFAALIGIIPILLGKFDNEFHELTTVISAFPISVWPTAGMVLAAVHYAATRARRDGSAELFETLPTSNEVRGFGMLGIAAAGVVLAIATMTFWIVLWLVVGVPGTPDTGTWIEMLTAIVTVAGAGVFGLLVARVAPWSLASIVAIVAVAAADGRLLAMSDRSERGRWFALWPGFLEFPRRFDTAPLGAHLAWVAALSALCTAVVLIAYHATARRAAGAAAVLVTVALCGAWQAQGASAARLETIVSDITNPLANQECRTDGQVRACAYRPYDDHLDWWVDISKRVLAATPESARVERRGELLMVQQLDTRLYRYLDHKVQKSLSTGAVPPPVSDALVLTWDSIDNPNMRFAHAMATAQWVVGLPVPTRLEQKPCSASGQPRGALALWLAASAMPNGRSDLGRAGPSEVLYPMDSNPSGPFVVPWRDGHVHESVVWTNSDIVIARALLAMPQADLRRKLAANWTALTRRDAPASLLYDLTGLTLPQGSSPGIETC